MGWGKITDFKHSKFSQASQLKTTKTFPLVRAIVACKQFKRELVASRQVKTT